MTVTVAPVNATIADVVSSPDVPKRIHVRSVSADDTVAHALEVLSDGKVVRAPVVDASGKAVAFVDVLDLIKYAVLDVADETKDSLDAASLARLNDKVAQAVNPAEARNKLMEFTAGSRLAEVLEAFGAGLHHVLVADEGKHYLLSQSDVVKYLDNHPTAFDNINGKTLTQLGLYPSTHKLQCIDQASTVAVAYRELYAGHHTAAPVVDAEGQIVGTLSVTDLKYTDPSDLTHLKMNVIEFLNNDESRGAGAPVSVHSDAFIGEVVLLLSHAGVHRVWVLDSAKKPVGVVSCTDLIERAVHV